MKRRATRARWVPLAIVLGMLCGGCVSANGLLTSIADDLALTTAAAAEGFVAGVLQRFLGL